MPTLSIFSTQQIEDQKMKYSISLNHSLMNLWSWSSIIGLKKWMFQCHVWLACNVLLLSSTMYRFMVSSLLHYPMVMHSIFFSQPVIYTPVLEIYFNIIIRNTKYYYCCAFTWVMHEFHGILYILFVEAYIKGFSLLNIKFKSNDFVWQT